jgi:tRNA/tmRNA/rRNA uracil-C5-methylase (TrmA/RlmC/RlmD family)
LKYFITAFIVFVLFSFGTCQTQTKKSPLQHRNDTSYTFGPHSADGIGKFYLGREISFVMGAEGAEWLERNNRQQEENTRLAIEKMQLSQNEIVADIGAGTGYYTFAIAQKIPGGKVYAVEIQDEMISLLNKRKRISGFKNVAGNKKIA